MRLSGAWLHRAGMVGVPGRKVSDDESAGHRLLWLVIWFVGWLASWLLVLLLTR